MTDWAEDDESRCDLCGRVFQEGESSQGWLDVEVTISDSQMLSVYFCSQEHAAEWFRHPLPEPDRSEPYTTTLRDRLVDAGMYALFAFLVIAFGIGCWTIVRWLLP
jgi:hypothetical protein